MKYNVLIVGAGNIGAFFDTPDDDKILTHAHAFSAHEGFKLIGFVDVDVEKAQKAADRWSCKAFQNIKEAFEYERFDVVCVAVPDKYHYTTLKCLSEFPVKVVLAEKPLTRTLHEANEIIKIYSSKNIDVAVNYSRRFVNDFEIIKKQIDKRAYGDYLTGTGYYGKGILHNGSHMIDLLRYFIGEIPRATFVSDTLDFFPDDKSMSAILTFENNKTFFLQHVDCRKYTIFEIDLLFENRRVRIYDSGFKIEEYEVRDSDIYIGYKNTTKMAEKNTSLDKSLYCAADNIYNHLNYGQKLKCGIEDGYNTLKTTLLIKECEGHE